MLGLKMSLEFEKARWAPRVLEFASQHWCGEDLNSNSRGSDTLTGLCGTSTHRCTQSTQIFKNLAVLLEIKCSCVLNVSSVFLHFIFKVMVPCLEGIAQMFSIDHESYQTDICGFYCGSCFRSFHKGGATLKPSLPGFDQQYCLYHLETIIQQLS